MDLSMRNADSTLELKEQKLTTRKNQKLAMEKKRRNRFNQLLNELKFMVLKGMGRDNVRYAKLEKTEILDMTYRYMKYLNFRLQRRHSSNDQIDCKTAQKELIDFITKYEREKSTPTTRTSTPPPSPSTSVSPPPSSSTSSPPPPSPSPPMFQLQPTNSTPYALTRPAMVPVTLPYAIQGQISPICSDNVGTADVVRKTIPPVSVVNPLPFPAHFINSESISYGYFVPGFDNKVAYTIRDQSFYRQQSPLSKGPSPKVWRPWNQLSL